MILTPRQIEEVNQRESTGWSEYLSSGSEGDPFGAMLHDAWQKEQDFQNVRATLAAYVSVVWNVARGSWLVVDDEGAYCVHCDEEAWIDEIVDDIRKYACNHAPGCPYAQARKLLGLEP